MYTNVFRMGAEDILYDFSYSSIDVVGSTAEVYDFLYTLSIVLYTLLTSIPFHAILSK